MYPETHIRKIVRDSNEFNSIPKEKVVNTAMVSYGLGEVWRTSKEQYDFAYSSLHKAKHIWKAIEEDCTIERWLGILTSPYPWRYHWKWRRYRFETSRFRQKDFKKKVLSEEKQRKKDWREYKRVLKDKSKRIRNYYSGSTKNFCVKLGHKKSRRWAKERLRHGDWDLERNWRKSWIDPWDWN